MGIEECAQGIELVGVSVQDISLIPEVVVAVKFTERIVQQLSIFGRYFYCRQTCSKVVCYPFLQG